MKPSPTFEDRLNSTGAVLRDRPSVVDRVMADVRRHAMEQITREKPIKEDVAIKPS